MTNLRHGADCFEILAFVGGFDKDKIYNVRHKETDEHLTMHVISKNEPNSSKLDSSLHSKLFRIPFFVCLRYTFETKSRSYLVLDKIDTERQLGKYYHSCGPFTLKETVFIAAEIITAISHLHVCCATYNQLDIRSIFLDNSGHVQLRRDIHDNKSWAQNECYLCKGNDTCFHHGNIRVEEEAVAKDWEDIGDLLCFLLTGKHAYVQQDNNNDHSRLYLNRFSYSLPSTLPEVAADFVKGLLQWRKNPLPTTLTQSHAFFTGIDWQKVVKRHLTPPKIFTVPPSEINRNPSYGLAGDIRKRSQDSLKKESYLPAKERYNEQFSHEDLKSPVSYNQSLNASLTNEAVGLDIGINTTKTHGTKSTVSEHCPDNITFVTAESLENSWKRRKSKSNSIAEGESSRRSVDLSLQYFDQDSPESFEGGIIFGEQNLEYSSTYDDRYNSRIADLIDGSVDVNESLIGTGERHQLFRTSSRESFDSAGLDLINKSDDRALSEWIPETTEYRMQEFDALSSGNSRSAKMPMFYRAHSYHEGFGETNDSYGYINQFKLHQLPNTTTLERASKLLDSNFENWRVNSSERNVAEKNQYPERIEGSKKQQSLSTSTEDIREAVEKANLLHKRLSQSLLNIRAFDDVTNKTRIPISNHYKYPSVESHHENLDGIDQQFLADQNELKGSDLVDEYLKSSSQNNNVSEDEQDSLKKTWPISTSARNIDTRLSKSIDNSKRNRSLIQKISDSDALHKIKQGAYLQNKKSFGIGNDIKLKCSRTTSTKPNSTHERQQRRLHMQTSKSLDEDMLERSAYKYETFEHPATTGDRKRRKNRTALPCDSLGTSQYDESTNREFKKIEKARNLSVPEVSLGRFVAEGKKTKSCLKQNSISSDELQDDVMSSTHDTCYSYDKNNNKITENANEGIITEGHDDLDIRINNKTCEDSCSKKVGNWIEETDNVSEFSGYNGQNLVEEDFMETAMVDDVFEANEDLEKRGGSNETPEAGKRRKVRKAVSSACANTEAVTASGKGSRTHPKTSNMPRIMNDHKATEILTTSKVPERSKIPTCKTKSKHSVDQTEHNFVEKGKMKKIASPTDEKLRSGKQKFVEVEKGANLRSDNIITTNHNPQDRKIIKKKSSLDSYNEETNGENNNNKQDKQSIDNMVTDKVAIKSRSKIEKKKRAIPPSSVAVEDTESANSIVRSKIPVSRKSLSTGAIAVRKPDTISSDACRETKMKALAFLSPKISRNAQRKINEAEIINTDLNENTIEERHYASLANPVDNNANNLPVDAVDLIDRLRVLSDGNRSGRNSPSIERRLFTETDGGVDRMNSVRKLLQPSITIEEATPESASPTPSLLAEALKKTGSTADDNVSRESSIGSASDLWTRQDEKQPGRYRRKYCRRSSSGASGKSNDSFDDTRQSTVTSPILTMNSSEEEISSQNKDLDRNSFYSGKSIDSGLSDIFESSREDILSVSDTTVSRGKAVAKSDSGVMKDIDDSLISQHNHEVCDKKSILQNETPTNERKAMAKCRSCHNINVPHESSKVESGKVCSDCKSKSVERKEAIVELIQTEINYGQDLRILKEEFYSPIKNGGILNPENVAAVFLNLQELIDVNSKLCITLQDDLEQCISKNDQELLSLEVGRAFLDNVEFFQAYEIFCTRQRQALELLENLTKKSELLKVFLQVSSKQNSKLRKMDLKSFLAMPVQRIMKYPLLLTRIFRATERGIPDRESLMIARRKIEEQISRINEIAMGRPAKLRKCKSTSALNQSDSAGNHLKKLAAEILDWKLEETQIILTGALEVSLNELIGASNWNRKAARKQFAVQGILCAHGVVEYRSSPENGSEIPSYDLPIKSEITDAAVILLKRKSSNKFALFKEPILLKQAVICHRSDVKIAFEICPIMSDPYTFVANEKHCENWLKSLIYLSRHLGMWRRRRNAMANIMIKSMS